MFNRLISFASFLVLFIFTACVDPLPDSATDPLPLPPEIETNKDRSVDPGDSFYDYCNGSWLKSHPIPATGTIGGFYDADAVMDQRVDQLKASVPDIGHFYELLDNMHGQPEKSQAYIDAQRARFPKPSTKEEAFLTIGKMIVDGVTPWSNPFVSTWNLQWKDGRLVATVNPPIKFPDTPVTTNPENLVPLSLTKAGEGGALALIVQGMGLNPADVFSDPIMDPLWSMLELEPLDSICQYIDEAWDTYEMFVSQERMEKANKKVKDALSEARISLSYTLSYHLADKYISPAFKEQYLNITREIQASLRNRIQKVTWMSETTKGNALDKLDKCGLFVAYPDEWHTDCVSELSDCETLVEAVHRNNRNIARLKRELIGGKDCFSYEIVQRLLDSNGQFVPSDLTLVNAMYAPIYNSVIIYPAILLPPVLPENVSKACSYAAFVMIGHEFTHGFDTLGSEYDKDGNKRNWWTVADKMAFEERKQNLIQCYSHLELDPERAPGVYGDGDRTQTENIADLGGFLTVLDAFEAHLKEEGYFGKVYEDQLRKFYECYAHIWLCQYGQEKFNNIQKTDVHSHARLRVNGVVMNTDRWYELFDVDRNNFLYLPTERRTYIW